MRLGLGRDDIARLTSSEDLRGVRRGIYALRHVDARQEDEIAAWLHFQRDRLPWERIEPPSSVVSHASAAALRRLGTIIPVKPVRAIVEATRRGDADRESILDAARHRKGPSKTLERRVTELLGRVA